MRTTALLVATLLLATPARAQEKIAEYDWSKLAEAKELAGGTPVKMDGRTALKIENTNSAPLRVSLLTIENPEITSQRYALVGEVKYESVKGDGYVETWNHFPAKEGEPKSGGKYFSRTLGEEGPMAKLTGTSTWREFILPFNVSGATAAPSKIEFNLFLPAQGTVYISPIRLIQYPDEGKEGAGLMVEPWWSDRSAGLIGGTAGAVFGCLAGALALLASKGRARGFVLGGSFALITIGAICAAAGLAAVMLRQPYAVWFPLFLFGILMLAIIPYRLKEFRRHYEELEIRRMQSLDT